MYAELSVNVLRTECGMFSWRERGLGAVRVQQDCRLIFVWELGPGWGSPSDDQLHQDHLSSLRSRFLNSPQPHTSRWRPGTGPGACWFISSSGVARKHWAVMAGVHVQSGELAAQALWWAWAWKATYLSECHQNLLPALRGPCEQEAENTRAGDQGLLFVSFWITHQETLLWNNHVGSGIHCPEVAVCFQRAMLQEESGRGALVGGS